MILIQFSGQSTHDFNNTYKTMQAIRITKNIHNVDFYNIIITGISFLLAAFIFLKKFLRSFNDFFCLVNIIKANGG